MGDNPVKPENFESAFAQLTGNQPLRWQRRLFDEWISNVVKEIIDLPTGLGKTMVMPIWLLARKINQTLGHRLIYVVDRRTVVDQATSLAESLVARSCCKFINDEYCDPPTISTLRGQFADNREWTHDPSRAAIIIGTVDMIGSRLLFSGYRSSYKQRPLDAGLLGQDSLLILDEAHLSAPFEKLIDGIGRFQIGKGKPMRVVKMSATTGVSTAERFKLEESDLAPGDTNLLARDTNPIVRRFEAAKRMTIRKPEGKKTVEQSIIEAAGALAQGNSRVVVFVRSPKTAGNIAAALRRYTSEANKKPKPYEKAVAVLTGTMRGLERDELVTASNEESHPERQVMQRFLKPDNDPAQGPAILVSTSAGEVGFDLNADHLVCDAAPIDSMIQRLGRANRRGDGNATVLVFDGETPPDTKSSPMTVATFNAMKLLRTPDGSPRDVSPKAIAELKKLKAKEIEAATSPKPTMVELTDILLDAWAMTTISEPMPGRPPVAAWLRGIVPEPPQTTIAWRAELDLEGFDQLGVDDIEEWYDAHPVLTHETLSVPADVAQEFLEALRNVTVESDSRAVVIERNGYERFKLGNFLKSLRKDDARLGDATVILPASVGGIQRGGGALDPKRIFNAKDVDGHWLDVEGKIVVASPDVADEHERYHYEYAYPQDGSEPIPNCLGRKLLDDNLKNAKRQFATFAIEIPGKDDHRRELVSFVPKKDRTELGTKKGQSLVEHVGLVEQFASEIADRLSLPAVFREALQFAAAWHDHGKDREAWQRAVGRKYDADGIAIGSAIGKSGGSMGRIAGNYRHEFGSLHQLTVYATALSKTMSPDVFDLAMHLIATHHGRGRPHFPKGGFDPDAKAKSPEIAIEAVHRFARLQRKYGRWHLAWLENLLRCADAMASSETEGGQNP